MLILTLTLVKVLRVHQTEFLYDGKLPSDKKMFSDMQRETPSGRGESEKASGLQACPPSSRVKAAQGPSSPRAAQSLLDWEAVGPQCPKHLLGQPLPELCIPQTRGGPTSHKAPGTPSAHTAQPLPALTAPSEPARVLALLGLDYFSTYQGILFMSQCLVRPSSGQEPSRIPPWILSLILLSFFSLISSWYVAGAPSVSNWLI